MVQQGQVFELASRRLSGERLWAHRYRTGGRESKRVQVGGFGSEQDAQAALERALEKLRRASRSGRRLTLAELVDEYLAQHEVSPVTLEKLRFLLTPAVQAFGGAYLDELDPVEISAWRMTVPRGYRFEATQALRQVLARAVVWRMLDTNPAKQGVENPQRRRSEKRPFESWVELEAVIERLEPRLGPMVLFAAATGMRPGEWIALEHRDIDRAGRVAYVNRSFSKGRLTCPKTEASIRAVPLQARALAALDQLPADDPRDLNRARLEFIGDGVEVREQERRLPLGPPLGASTEQDDGRPPGAACREEHREVGVGRDEDVVLRGRAAEDLLVGC
jgi:integrase